MPSTLQLDACGRRRSPATLSSFHQGRPPRNKGQRYPADPPTVEEIIAVMHAAGEDNDAVRLRGLIVVLWRRSAHQRGAGAQRERPGSAPRRDPGPSRQRRQTPRSRNGSLGLGAADPMAAASRDASSWRLILRASRPDRRSLMGSRRCPLPAAPRGRSSGRPTSVRATSAAACPRGRDVARRCAAARHPTPTRACRPRHHFCLPARD